MLPLRERWEGWEGALALMVLRLLQDSPFQDLDLTTEDVNFDEIDGMSANQLTACGWRFVYCLRPVYLMPFLWTNTQR
jgi:hypothetical protein